MATLDAFVEVAETTGNGWMMEDGSRMVSQSGDDGGCRAGQDISPEVTLWDWTGP